MTGTAKPIAIIEASDLTFGGGARPLRAGSAFQVIDVTDEDVPLEGGSTMLVYVIPEAEASGNGGRIIVLGNSPVPVKKVNGRPVSGGGVIAVYPVLADGSYDSDFGGGVVVTTEFLLLESGDGILLETGDHILLEGGASPVAPAAPSALSADIGGDYAIALSWTDNSDNEAMFFIERSPDGVGSWEIIGVVDAGVTSYTDEPISQSTTYYYRVRAFGAAGYSNYSNIANKSVPPVSMSNLSSSTLVTGTIGGGDWHGRATIEELADGTLVMVIRTGTGHGTMDDQLHIMFSDDYGANWTAFDTDLNGDPVADFPAYPPNTAPADPYGVLESHLYLAPNNDLILHCWRLDLGTAHDGTYQITSSDGGITWSAWSKLDISGTADDDNIFMTDDYFVYSDVIYAGAREYQNLAFTVCKNLLIKSTDNGGTWELVSEITSFDENTEEVGLLFQGDSHIIANLRSMSFEHTYQKYSTDMGLTWIGYEDMTSQMDIAGRQRIKTIAQIKGEASWWTDTFAVMNGFVFRVPGSGFPRRNAIWVTRDGGETWSGAFYVDAEMDDAGYGDMFYDAINEKFVFISYQGTQAAADIKQYKFDLAGLE